MVAGLLLSLVGLAVVAPSTGAATTVPKSRCFAPAPGPDIDEHYITYSPGCRGHDEVDIAPFSTVAHTASDITWVIVLPKDGAVGTGGHAVVDLGPTFWIGAGAKDAKSLFGQAFVELQFYPDSKLVAPYCKNDGSFFPVLSANTFTACAPVWAVSPSTFQEYAAFNGLVRRSGSTSQLVMHGGDTVRIHFFKGSQAGHPWNITVSDLTTATDSEPLVLTGGVDGALSPLDGVNTPANYVQWSAMQQAPLSLAWEIGHPNFFRYPLAPYCVPGQFNCWSYNVTGGWKHTAPLQIKSVKFNNDAVSPKAFAVSDTQGGGAQDEIWCGAHDAPGANGFCGFPWYSYNGSKHAVLFGGDYAGATYNYGAYNQFPKEGLCSGGRFCAQVLNPRPPLP